MNIFRGITKNGIFLGVILVTIVLQAIIVQFGGEAFKTSGLGWQAWLVSIAVGFGSLPVGILVRLLPEWGSPETVQPSVESEGPTGIVVEGVEMEQRPTGTEKTLQSIASLPSDATLQRWNTAIRRTQMQVRVVNAFRLPADSDSIGSVPSRPGTPTYRLVGPDGQEGPRGAEDLWKKAQTVKKSIGVVNAFRGGRRNMGVDFTTLQMVDPAQVRARQQAASSGEGRWATVSVADSRTGLSEKY